MILRVTNRSGSKITAMIGANTGKTSDVSSRSGDRNARVGVPPGHLRSEQRLNRDSRVREAQTRDSHWSNGGLLYRIVARHRRPAIMASIERKRANASTRLAAVGRSLSGEHRLTEMRQASVCSKPAATRNSSRRRPRYAIILQCVSEHSPRPQVFQDDRGPAVLILAVASLE